MGFAAINMMELANSVTTVRYQKFVIGRSVSKQCTLNDSMVVLRSSDGAIYVTVCRV